MRAFSGELADHFRLAVEEFQHRPARSYFEPGSRLPAAVVEAQPRPVRCHGEPGARLPVAVGEDQRRPVRFHGERDARLPVAVVEGQPRPVRVHGDPDARLPVAVVETQLWPVRVHAERGEFAIAADSEGAIFGLLNSQSGDPGDYRAEEGEWLWHVLYSRQVNSSALFYQERFDYEMFEYAWNDETRRLVLASQDYARASVSPIPEDDQDNRPAWIGFIKTADVPGAVARAKALGAEVLFAPSPDVHNNGIAIIADPLGGIIGLLSWVTTDGGDQP